MLVLDAVGKADLFQGAFDVALYRTKINQVKIQTVNRYFNDQFYSNDAVDFVKSKGMKMPPFLYSKIRNLPRRIHFYLKRKRKAKQG